MSHHLHIPELTILALFTWREEEERLQRSDGLPSLYVPHLDYCDIVCGNCGKKLRDKLQKLQNRAAHVLTFSNYDADATELLEFLSGT